MFRDICILAFKFSNLFGQFLWYRTERVNLTVLQFQAVLVLQTAVVVRRQVCCITAALFLHCSCGPVSCCCMADQLLQHSRTAAAAGQTSCAAEICNLCCCHCRTAELAQQTRLTQNAGNKLSVFTKRQKCSLPRRSGKGKPPLFCLSSLRSFLKSEEGETNW